MDVEAIRKACAANGVAVEINSHPWRLDLDWRWHQLALKFGCLLTIDPDAHSVDEIDNLRLGTAMARKGGIPAARVLNSLDRNAFAQHIRRRRLAMETRTRSGRGRDLGR